MSSPFDRYMKDMVKPEGYKGHFVDNQADGAIPNGTRIYKGNSRPADRNPDGTPGTVLGSIDVGVQKGNLAAVGGINYFIAWDSDPWMPVLLNHRMVVDHIPTSTYDASEHERPRGMTPS